MKSIITITFDDDFPQAVFQITHSCKSANEMSQANKFAAAYYAELTRPKDEYEMTKEYAEWRYRTSGGSL